MSALVTQVLEPTIGNYFRNAAQGSDIIDFLKNRSSRQEAAADWRRASTAPQPANGRRHLPNWRPARRQLAPRRFAAVGVAGHTSGVTSLVLAWRALNCLPLCDHDGLC
jgi:hypothetical protein